MIFDSWLVNTPIAHRGFHTDTAPENSIASFDEAIKRGYAIEIDVRATKDGVVVVFHDEKLSRMTGIDGYLSNCEYSAIKNLHLAKSKQTIPTLKETLAFVKGRVPLLIEIKNSHKVSFEKDVWKELKNYKGEYAIQSFNPYSLEWFKINAPQVKRGQLSSFFEGESSLSYVKKYLLKRLRLNKVSEPNFIAYDIRNMPNKYVKKAAKKMPVLVWWVTSKEQATLAREFADNIIFENFEP